MGRNKEDGSGVMMTRLEHLKWCRERAIQEMDYYKDPTKAIVSMMSDLGKHPETNHESLKSLCMMMLMANQIKTRQDAIKFLSGFN